MEVTIQDLDLVPGPIIGQLLDQFARHKQLGKFRIENKPFDLPETSRRFERRVE
jgi:hypothetical protein